MSVSSPKPSVGAPPAGPTPEGPEPSQRSGAGILGSLYGRLPQHAPPVYRRHYYLGVVVFAVVVGAVGTYWSSDPYRLGIMTNAMMFAIAALGLYFAYSLAGLFAFSQGAFMGIGAYTSVRVAENNGFVAGFAAAIVVTLLVGLVVGFLLRRARHLYFAIGALAFAELAVLLFRNWDVFTGGRGAGIIYGIGPPEVAGREFFEVESLFWFVLAITCAALVLGAWLERSPARRNALATKEIGTVAHASGIPVYKVVIFLFGFGASLAGIAGSLQAHSIGSITPEAFDVGLAIDLYLMILLGGLGTMWGAVVGAFFVTWLPELLRPVKEYETVVFSMLLLVTIILLPEGVVGTLSKFGRAVGRRVRRN